MTAFTNVLRAYLMGFIIVLLSFASLLTMGCDTGTSEYMRPLFTDCEGEPDFIIMGQSNANWIFADAMINVFGNKIIQINHSGQPIESWTEGPFLSEDLAFISGRSSDFFIWFQGESNSGLFDSNYDGYEEKLKGIINSLAGEPTVIIIGVHCTYFDMSIFRDYQKEICSINDWIYIDTSDLFRPDGIHLDSGSFSLLSDRILLETAGKW